ncbi:hypothetical protein AK812_SmicGene6547 [Symbiodinium microadriaticum]|uniref:Uncharacterized protein n=1 Tax=Symbiodinium microadriaticum TaxID=2951 RepID=A0A1Q9EQS5_SYMMI|nr:hypothetical protein AK812_SmicGene6547 [Symbiodinium microadriaticum]
MNTIIITIIITITTVIAIVIVILTITDQLEKIACRSEESTHLAPWNPNRPPLPVSADTTGEWERLSYTNAAGAADTARNGHMAVTSGVRGMYGLSPRTPANTGKMSKKAKRTF